MPIDGERDLLKFHFVFQGRNMRTLAELSSETQLVFAGLNEMQKRHVAALISKILGHGGQTQLANVTGIDYKTIRHGCSDLENHMSDCPVGRIRKPGGGRPSVKKNAGH
jgi:hypothetical protein